MRGSPRKPSLEFSTKLEIFIHSVFALSVLRSPAHPVSHLGSSVAVGREGIGQKEEKRVIDVI